MKKISFIMMIGIISLFFAGLFIIQLSEGSWKSSKSVSIMDEPRKDTALSINEDNLTKKSLSSTNLLNEVTYYNEQDKQWVLIWSDEFDSVQLHRSKWQKENWAAEKNNELQFYRPENVTVDDGFLKLISKKEMYDDREYTSGAIHSKEKFSFLYGKVEMRAKLPKGQGIFPAFWMMPDVNDRWLPEIDIMEMLGHKPNESWMVLHWLDEKGELSTVSQSYIGENFADGFHTFGIEWTPEKVSWFIDGVKRFETTTYIPTEDMYLYLNTAIGGNWPGTPDETTTFPQYFEVDYVRVYQQNGAEI
ncbi:beta-glucanase (GH16 family) [Salirhabdus euzebyi]|uniref:licheninase n=1 Tax=Salirhabdus euzebyi TaxID=394506 RepID=A0A841PS31_9BACI|nr:glycoside hydrolase family 16 protein [Salirhabdus euzebyi]MBB6451737.1 beta-glucanase (GH16 family) [Salirhabdus euzebyi]